MDRNGFWLRSSLYRNPAYGRASGGYRDPRAVVVGNYGGGCGAPAAAVPVGDGRRRPGDAAVVRRFRRRAGRPDFLGGVSRHLRACNTASCPGHRFAPCRQTNSARRLLRMQDRRTVACARIGTGPLELTIPPSESRATRTGATYELLR